MATASFMTDLVEVATQAAEAAAGIAGVVAGMKIVELSRDYYNLYKRQRDFYYNTFQTGVEAPLALETYADPLPALDYPGRIQTLYNSDTGPMGGQSADDLNWWNRHAAAYSTNIPQLLVQQAAAARAAVLSDWTNYLFRYEEWFTRHLEDDRWRKRLALHNMALKQGAGLTSSMSEALGAYQDNIADLGAQLATYGNGIAKWSGYKKGEADTEAAFSNPGYTGFGVFTPVATDTGWEIRG